MVRLYNEDIICNSEAMGVSMEINVEAKRGKERLKKRFDKQNKE